MNSKRLPRVVSLLFLTGLVLTGTSAAPQQTKAASQPPAMPYVVPPTRSVLGKSYAQWSADWWTWSLQIPFLTNHPSYSPCNNSFDVTLGQSGQVWFLAGTFGACVRDVRIPSGKWLFIPMINSEASDMEPAPYYGCTVAQQTAAATLTANYIQQPYFELDGVALPAPRTYRVVSPQFSFVLPVPNFLGVLAATTTLCTYAPPALPMHGTGVSDGYWVMLEPLPVGTHLVRIGGKFVVGGVLLGTIDTTYKITVF